MIKYIVLGLLVYSNIVFAANLISNKVHPISLPKDEGMISHQVNISMPDKVIIPVRGGYFHTFYTLDIMLEGQGPYRFILDTGAEFNYISESVTKKLNLKVKYINKTKAITPVGNVKINENIYHANFVKIGDMEIKNLPFFGVDSFEDESLEFVQNGIVGVIGLSTFNQLLLTLDLANERIILSRDSIAEGTESGKIRMVNYSPRIKVKLSTENVYYTEVIPDTGYSGQFNFTFCDRKKPTIDEKDRLMVEMMDLYKNKQQSYLANLKGTISFSGVTLQDPAIVYSVKPCTDEQLSQSVTGIMGVKILNQYKVKIDQINKRIQFIPN